MDLDVLDTRVLKVEKRLAEHEEALKDAGVRRQAGPHGFVDKPAQSLDEDRIRVLIREEVARAVEELGLTEELPEDEAGEEGAETDEERAAGEAETGGDAKPGEGAQPRRRKKKA